MTEEKISFRARVLPFVVVLVLLLRWAALELFILLAECVLAWTLAVARGLVVEFRNGRLVDDVVASLFRVTTGFALAVFTGIPIGLWLGHHARARLAFLPVVNFLRSL
jgi:ABC-type nitrate/sulfonate/bicarbonate transport system permease component